MPTDDIEQARAEMLLLHRKLEECHQKERRQRVQSEESRKRVEHFEQTCKEKDKEINQLHERIVHLHEHIDTVRAVFQENEQRKSQLEEALSIADPDNNAAELSRLREEIRTYQKREKSLQEVKAKMVAMASSLREEVKRELKNNQEAIDKAKSVEDANTNLKQKIQSLQKSLSDAKVELKASEKVKKDSDTKTAQLKKLRRELQELTSKMSEKEEEMTAVSSEIGELKESISSLTSEKETAEARIRELESTTAPASELAMLSKQIETLKTEKEKMRKDLERFQQMSQSKVGGADEAKAKLEKVEGEKQKLENKLRDIEKNNSNLQKNLEAMKRASEEKSKEAKAALAENKELTFLKKKNEAVISDLTTKLQKATQPFREEISKHKEEYKAQRKKYEGSIKELKKKHIRRLDQEKKKNTVVIQGYTEKEVAIAGVTPIGIVFILWFLLNYGSYLFNPRTF